MDGAPNATLLLIITSTIVNHSVSRILIQDGKSCKVMYVLEKMVWDGATAEDSEDPEEVHDL